MLWFTKSNATLKSNNVTPVGKPFPMFSSQLSFEWALTLYNDYFCKHVDSLQVSCWCLGTDKFVWMQIIHSLIALSKLMGRLFSSSKAFLLSLGTGCNLATFHWLGNMAIGFEMMSDEIFNYKKFSVSSTPEALQVWRLSRQFLTSNESKGVNPKWQSFPAIIWLTAFVTYSIYQ